MKAEHKISINVPLEKVYQTAETYPLFVESFQDKRILSSNEEALRVRITNIFFNVPLTWEGEGKKKKNESISWIQTNGLLKGLRADWIFAPIEDSKTEVTIKGEFSAEGVTGIFLNFIAPALIAKATNRILKSLKLAAEC